MRGVSAPATRILFLGVSPHSTPYTSELPLLCPPVLVLPFGSSFPCPLRLLPWTLLSLLPHPFLRTRIPVLLCILTKDQHQLFHAQFWSSGLQHELGPMASPLQSNLYA